MDWEDVVDTLVANVPLPDLGFAIVGSLSLALLTGLSWICPKTGSDAIRTFLSTNRTRSLN